MNRATKQDVAALLLELYRSHRPFVSDTPWESEQERWNELVLAILVEGLDIPVNVARSVIWGLAQAGLLTLPPTRAAKLRSSAPLIDSLIEGGLKPAEARTAAAMVERVARVVGTEWGGHIQRVLRTFGNSVASELAAKLSTAGLDQRDALRISKLWLQNVRNIPLLRTDTPHFKNFAAKTGLAEQQILDAADDLGLNVTMLDDLLASNHAHATSSAPRRTRPRPTGRGTGKRGEQRQRL